MAAASPRKSRRTKGRHRKPSNLQAAKGAQWLRVGAVGIGLAAAIASGHGVASATPDDSSNAGSAGPSAGDATSNGNTSDESSADDDNDSPSSRHESKRSRTAPGSGQSADATDEDATDSPESEPAPDETEPAPPADEPESPIDEPSDAAQPETAQEHSEPPAEDAAVEEPEDDAEPPADTTPTTQASDSEEPVGDVTVTSSTPDVTPAEPDTSTAAATTTSATVTVETASAPTSFNDVLNVVLNWIGLGAGGDAPLPGGVLESIWLAMRQNDQLQAGQRELEREALQAAFSRSLGWIPVLGTVSHGIFVLGNLAELGSAVLRGDSADIGDEIADITRDLVGMVPVVGAPIAASLHDLAAPPTPDVAALSTTQSAMAAAAASPYDTTIGTLQAILLQLVGWPTPPTPFTTPANYTLEQALDAHDDFIDLLFANPTPSTRWIPDTMALVNLFFRSSLPGYSFSDGLNTFADLLNRITPPYKLEDSVEPVMTKAQVAAASVGALVKIMDRLLAGDFDPQSLQNAATEGGTAGFINPSSILGMSFATSAEPNPFSLMAYIALVGVYKRFQMVATNHLPVVTSITQTGQFVTVVSGKLNATDPDGDALTYTFTEPSKGTVTVEADGTWRYWRNTDFSQSDTDTFTITINDGIGQVERVGLDHPYSPLGHTVTVTVTVNYTATSPNSAPTAVALPGLPDSMGIVRGSVSGSDIDGDTLTYSLVNPGTSGATGNSIYTSEGGIVQLNTTTGQFVYIPKVSTDLIPAFDNDSFQVVTSDGRGGTTTTTVVVISNLKPTTSTTSTSAYTENGKVDVPTANVGLLNYSLGSGPAKGSVVVHADGTYTYTRNPAATGSTDDSFTIVGTDANGKTVTLPVVSVSPPLVSITPTTSVSGGSFIPRGMVNGTAWTAGTQSTTGTFSGTDANGNPVTVSGGSYTSTRGGIVTVTSGGGFLYTYSTMSDAFHKAGAANATAADKVDTVKINVTDSFGGVTEVTFSITLRTENNNPSSSSSVGSPNGLGVVRGSVSGSDSDGDSFTYSLAGAGNPAGATSNSTYTTNGGIVALNADGSFTYIPNRSASTSDSFKVLVSDGHGGATTETVTVSLSTPSPVTNVNTSTPNKVTGQLNVPASDSGLMTYSLGTGPSKGTVTVNSDGTFTYNRTAGLGHTTTPGDSFSVIGTDIATGKTVTIAMITVTPTVANAVPVSTGVTVATSSLNDTDIGFNRQQTTTGTLGATDADGDPLTFAAGTYTTNDGGSVTVAANGSFTYTSDKKLKGTEDLHWHNAALPGALGDTFTVSVNDGFGGVVSIVYSIPFEKLNENPSSTVSVGNKTTDALGVVRGTLTGSDPDNSDIDYTIHGAEDILGYSLSGAGNPSGATSTSSATANGGIVQLNGNSFTYIPTQGVTSDSFKVLVSDGHGGTAVATISLGSLTTPSPVTNINTSTPNVVTGQLDIPAGDTGLGLTYSVGSGPSKGTVNVTGSGTFTYTRTSPGHSTPPADSFTIKATDSLGRQVTIATVNVTPTVVNNAPAVSVVTQPLVGSRSGTTQTTTGKITWSDADGDALKINGQTAPTSSPITIGTRNGGSVTLNADGTFSYSRTVSNAQSHAAARIGAADNERYDYIDVTVTDDYNGSTTLAVQVAVYATNSAPTISAGVRIGNSISSINVNDSDSGDSLSFSVSPSGWNWIFGGKGVATSSLTRVSGSSTTVSLTVTDGYYVVSGGNVTSTPSSTTRTWS